MENKDKLIKQAIYLLNKVLTGWPTCPLDQDLLRQEIEVYLKQFQPKPKKQNKYRQSDITELINRIINGE